MFPYLGETTATLTRPPCPNEVSLFSGENATSNTISNKYKQAKQIIISKQYHKCCNITYDNYVILPNENKPDFKQCWHVYVTI